MNQSICNGVDKGDLQHCISTHCAAVSKHRQYYTPHSNLLNVKAKRMVIQWMAFLHFKHNLALS